MHVPRQTRGVEGLAHAASWPALLVMATHLRPQGLGCPFSYIRGSQDSRFALVVITAGRGIFSLPSWQTLPILGLIACSCVERYEHWDLKSALLVLIANNFAPQPALLVITSSPGMHRPLLLITADPEIFQPALREIIIHLGCRNPLCGGCLALLIRIGLYRSGRIVGYRPQGNGNCSPNPKLSTCLLISLTLPY